MPVKDRNDLSPIPTTPLNNDQPPRFGGITELVKDAFVIELTNFMSTGYSRLRPGELPRIDKYQVALDVDTDPLATAVNLIRSYPDIMEDMPLLAVLAATGSNLKLSISDKYVNTMVPAAEVYSSITSGTYQLSGGQTLDIETHPSGRPGEVAQSSFKFPSFMFKNISSATLDEVVSVINFQALYCTAFKFKNQEGTYSLGLRAGGPNGKEFPNRIKIIGGTSLSALGLTIGQEDQNYGPGKKVLTRHVISANMTVGIEVVTESENVRTELSDLLFDFLTFVMADRQFQFFGRSTFDPNVQDETYQIIIRDNEVSISGEQELPRPSDPKDKIYVNRINVPVTVMQYTDRYIVTPAGEPAYPISGITLVTNEDLPDPN